MNNETLACLAASAAPVGAQGNIHGPVVDKGGFAAAWSSGEQHHTAFRKDASDGPAAHVIRHGDGLGVQHFNFLFPIDPGLCFIDELVQFAGGNFQAVVGHPLPGLEQHTSVVYIEANHGFKGADDLLKGRQAIVSLMPVLAGNGIDDQFLGGSLLYPIGKVVAITLGERFPFKGIGVGIKPLGARIVCCHFPHEGHARLVSVWTQDETVVAEEF